MFILVFLLAEHVYCASQDCPPKLSYSQLACSVLCLVVATIASIVQVSSVDVWLNIERLCSATYDHVLVSWTVQYGTQLCSARYDRTQLCTAVSDCGGVCFIAFRMCGGNASCSSG